MEEYLTLKKSAPYICPMRVLSKDKSFSPIESDNKELTRYISRKGCPPIEITQAKSQERF
jgi:hypothetical protein